MNPEAIAKAASFFTGATTLGGAIFAFLGVFALYFTNKDSKNKEAALARFQTEATARDNEARASIETAQAKIIDGEAKIVAAEERIAITRKEAANAALETERVKQQLAWRTITAEDANRMVYLLSRQPGDLLITYVQGDPEALYLLAQFSQIFEAAGWQVGNRGDTAGGGILFGVSVPMEQACSQQSVALVLAAIAQSHIPFHREQPPPARIMFQAQRPGPQTVLIYIGPKLPPTFSP